MLRKNCMPQRLFINKTPNGKMCDWYRTKCITLFRKQSDDQFVLIFIIWNAIKIRMIITHNRPILFIIEKQMLNEEYPFEWIFLDWLCLQRHIRISCKNIKYSRYRKWPFVKLVRLSTHHRLECKFKYELVKNINTSEFIMK